MKKIIVLIMSFFLLSFTIDDGQKIIVLDLVSEDVELTNFQIESAQEVISSTIRENKAVAVVKKSVMIPEGETSILIQLDEFVQKTVKGVTANSCVYGFVEVNSKGFEITLKALEIKSGKIMVAKQTFQDKTDVFSAAVRAAQELCSGKIVEADEQEIEKEFVKRDFVKVSGGSYILGANYHKKSNTPEHKVEIADFTISPYEVTLNEFDTFITESGYTIERGAFEYGSNGFTLNSLIYWGEPGYTVYNNMPVTCVSWFDAIEYCNWLSQKKGLTKCYSINDEKVTWDRTANGYRLPTEKEWEYAASGGVEERATIFAGSDYAHFVAWFKDNSDGSPETPGSLSPNSLGLYDMSGNVWEWCWDSYSESYDSDIDENYRVYRGGSWNSSRMNCLIINRMGNLPSIRANLLGFRIVKNNR